MRSNPRGLQRAKLTNRRGEDVPAELRKRFGDWLRERRLGLGMIQQELADKVGGVNSTVVSGIEIGRASIPTERYALYARALEMTEAAFAEVVLRHVNPWLYKAIFNSRDPQVLDDIARMSGAVEEKPPKRNPK